jgi:probable phosphoglycerate mutase
MLTLTLVRHGQTDYSRANRFCGSIDPPLNADGLAMAEALGAHLGAQTWTAIYASPRTRTLQTAGPTARRAKMEITVEDGLREIEYGSWEGRQESEVEASEPERFHAWASHPARVSPPGGETAVEIATRALAVVDAIRERHGAGKVLVVSHKATLRVLLCALLGIDVDLFRARIAQKVAALSIVELRASGPLLQVLGDDSFLSAELRAAGGT